MADEEKITEELDVIKDHLARHDQLIEVLGCAVPANMEADTFWREVYAGAKAVSRFAALLAIIGRFVLMIAGVVLAMSAAIAHWRGPQ